MGGGPSIEQKQAASTDAALAQQEAKIADERNQREADQYAAVKPYAMSRIQNGLPFFNNLTDSVSGESARAWAPAYAAANTRFAGSDLPSGSKDAALAGVDAERARTFDSGLTNALFANEQAKSEAARLLTNQQQIANPLGFYTAAGQTNNSVLQAPLQSAGLGGVLGGVAGQLGSAAINKIPF